MTDPAQTAKARNARDRWSTLLPSRGGEASTKRNGP